ncbi:uncharacterized protein LOC124161180 isoform X3 [Ischnura elegans]|uniref:uncharacterized protein LOC124161180 isoform X3 n=1 Tax=Ischnura elegans TaxID=197161 RepID=UPI001ED885C6|nr:uncharacterized protein LOC124161180 isoform X3 [Ischnura elegans]
MSERNTSSRSEVWQYFHKLGIREAQCKICKAIIQKKGSTSSLWGHLRARHVSLKTNHPSIQQNEPSEVDKYSTTNDSTPNNRDRDPLIIDGSGSETSEAKIEEEYSREEQTWVIPDEYESAEDPSEESLTEKNQTVSTNSIPIKITGKQSEAVHVEQQSGYNCADECGSWSEWSADEWWNLVETERDCFLQRCNIAKYTNRVE